MKPTNGNNGYGFKIPNGLTEGSDIDPYLNELDSFLDRRQRTRGVFDDGREFVHRRLAVFDQTAEIQRRRLDVQKRKGVGASDQRVQHLERQITSTVFE